MKPAIIILSILIFFVSCSDADFNNKEREASVSYDEKEAASEKEADDFISSSAAVENKKDTTRKFIRKADLKFKVENVLKSTYDIENITSTHGGYVTYTNLSSNIERTKKTDITADSTLKSTYYEVTNKITLRVPNTKLDTTLKDISRNIDFLDYRIIEAENVFLQLLANELTQIRSEKNEERLTEAIDQRGKELTETALAEQLLLRKQELADQAKIANLSLQDQIDFSTVELYIYQSQTIKKELIANEKNITEYEPSFGTKIFNSLKFGWELLEALLVFLVKLWGFLVLGIIVFMAYKLYLKFKK